MKALKKNLGAIGGGGLYFRRSSYTSGQERFLETTSRARKKSLHLSSRTDGAE